MKKATIIVVAYCLGLFCACNPAYSWSDAATHAAITDKAVHLSTMDDYLKNQLGISQGLSAEFQTVFYPALEERMADLDPARTNRSVLDWVKTGSQLEDKTLKQSRSRYHFHDPIRNAGLDNKTDHPEWEKYAPTYYGFDFTGESALNWAIDGASDKEPTTNLEKWSLARGRFYNAITYTAKSDRDRNMAMSLLSLGSVAHLLEDMGVPAHTRNDFLFGHYKTWYDYPWGNDLENWVEKVVKNNGGQSPWSGSSPAVFDKLTKYFDADVYLGGYLGDGVLPPNTWGLSECSNYQFLSTSTMFGCSGTKYQFPHPAIEHAPPNLFELVPDGNKVYFNGLNYGVPHLARESYTYYIATDWGYYGPLIDNTNTTDDTNVFEDYANITVPRSINYATGLINYFFRGKLSIEQTGSGGGKIQITITNKSTNSDVNQILRGGTFTLYWDDSSGNRTAVSDFNVYRPGTEPVPGNEWNSTDTQFNYDQNTKGVFTPPTQGNVQYILIYEGIISSNPNSSDSDDTHQIATGKAQMGFVTCVLCPVGTNARNLTVKISNIPACNNVCVGMGGSDESSWKYNNVPDMDGEYVLPLIDSADGSNYWCPNCGQCVWQNTYSGNFGSALRYGDYDNSCVGDVQDITNFTTLVVRVVLIKALSYYPYPGWSLSVSWYLYPMVYGNGTNFVLSGGVALYSETATPPPDCANYVWESTTDNDCFTFPGWGWRTRLSPTSKVELIMGQ